MFIFTQTEIKALPKDLHLSIEASEKAKFWHFQGVKIELFEFKGCRESHCILMKNADSPPSPLAFGSEGEMRGVLAGLARALSSGHNLFNLDEALKTQKKRAD